MVILQRLTPDIDSYLIDLLYNGHFSESKDTDFPSLTSLQSPKHFTNAPTTTIYSVVGKLAARTPASRHFCGSKSIKDEYLIVEASMHGFEI